MSAAVAAPSIHEWVDKLSPTQQAHLRVVASQDSALPPIEEEATETTDEAVELWLREKVLPTHLRVVAGGGRAVSIDESRTRISTRLAAAATS